MAKETKEPLLSENNLPATQPVPKPKSKAWLLILALILILLVGGYFLWTKVLKKVLSPQTSFSGELSLKTPKLEEDKAKSAVVGPAGGIISVQASDGTLYTLTVPEESVILPSQVTMTPLKEVPFNNYSQANAGLGVVLTGKFSFIRPAYLTVQPNTQKPAGKIKFNSCSVGSRGYDPEVCAGLAGIPFVAGVAPGQVIIYGDQEDKDILLTPTVFTGMKDTYNGYVFSPGVYLADKVTKKEVESLAVLTFKGGNDYLNRAEVLIHLAALGGDLTPYKDEISRFAREKDDYPREVLKGAIVALAAGDTTTAQARTDDYSKEIKQKAGDIRSTFIPWMRYAALTIQVKNMAAKKHLTASRGWIKKVLASESQLQDWDSVRNNPNGGDTSPDNSLRNYEGDNGVEYGDEQNHTTSWDDINNSLLPPDNEGSGKLRDWSQVEADDAEQEKADDAIENGCWDTLKDPHATACEKDQAIRTLIALGRAMSYMRSFFSSIMEKCANECTTMEECEGIGNIGEKWGNTHLVNLVNGRIIFLLQQAEECDLAKKKGLEDFGQNTCEIPLEE